MSPLTSHITMGSTHCGHAIISQGQIRGRATSPRSLKLPGPGASRGDRGWADTELRLNNYDNRARSRRQANSSDDNSWAATTLLMQDQANCLLDEPPDPGKQQRCSRQGGYRQCQMNFATGWIQNATQRSDRQTFSR